MVTEIVFNLKMFIAKIQFFYSKFSKKIAKSTFFYGFDLKIGFLGSIYPYHG
jgi:hypothetical protein